MGHGRGRKISSARHRFVSTEVAVAEHKKALAEMFEAIRATWADDPNPLCDWCKLPKGDIQERVDCFSREILGDQHATMVSCLDCWRMWRLEI